MPEMALNARVKLVQPGILHVQAEVSGNNPWRNRTYGLAFDMIPPDGFVLEPGDYPGLDELSMGYQGASLYCDWEEPEADGPLTLGIDNLNSINLDVVEGTLLHHFIRWQLWGDGPLPQYEAGVTVWKTLHQPPLMGDQLAICLALAAQMATNDVTDSAYQVELLKASDLSKAFDEALKIDPDAWGNVHMPYVTWMTKRLKARNAVWAVTPKVVEDYIGLSTGLLNFWAQARALGNPATIRALPRLWSAHRRDGQEADAEWMEAVAKQLEDLPPGDWPLFTEVAHNLACYSHPPANWPEIIGWIGLDSLDGSHLEPLLSEPHDGAWGLDVEIGLPTWKESYHSLSQKMRNILLSIVTNTNVGYLGQDRSNVRAGFLAQYLDPDWIIPMALRMGLRCGVSDLSGEAMKTALTRQILDYTWVLKCLDGKDNSYTGALTRWLFDRGLTIENLVQWTTSSWGYAMPAISTILETLAGYILDEPMKADVLQLAAQVKFMEQAYGGKLPTRFDVMHDIAGHIQKALVEGMDGALAHLLQQWTSREVQKLVVALAEQTTPGAGEILTYRTARYAHWVQQVLRLAAISRLWKPGDTVPTVEPIEGLTASALREGITRAAKLAKLQGGEPKLAYWRALHAQFKTEAEEREAKRPKSLRLLKATDAPKVKRGGDAVVVGWDAQYHPIYGVKYVTNVLGHIKIVCNGVTMYEGTEGEWKERFAQAQHEMEAEKAAKQHKANQEAEMAWLPENVTVTQDGLCQAETETTYMLGKAAKTPWGKAITTPQPDPAELLAKSISPLEVQIHTVNADTVDATGLTFQQMAKAINNPVDAAMKKLSSTLSGVAVKEGASS